MGRFRKSVEGILLKVWWLYSYEVSDPTLNSLLLEAASVLEVKPFKKVKVSERFPIANAAVVGFRCKTVVVTKALLRLMDTKELKAVLLHEYAHCRQRHQIKLLTVALVVLFLVMLPTSLVLLDVESEILSALLLLPVAGTAYLFVLVVVRYLARRFEFEADLVAVNALGDPSTYIGMLKKLKLFNGEPQRGFIANILRSHPYTDERMENIARRANVKM